MVHHGPRVLLHLPVEGNEQVEEAAPAHRVPETVEKLVVMAGLQQGGGGQLSLSTHQELPVHLGKEI